MCGAPGGVGDESRSFGVNGAVVTISDPEFEEGHSIDGARMGRIVNDNGIVTRDTECVIVSQQHKELVCTAPKGLGKDLEVKLSLEGVDNVNATHTK